MAQLFFYLFCGSLSVLLFYYLGIFSRLAFWKKPLYTPSTEGISIIVCAHDEEENLKRLLPRLYEQQYPSFEIIIVNDRSNDGTYDFLREESAKNPLLKPVQVDHAPDHVNGKKYGLTLGVKAAKYDRLLFTDADCFPSSKDWIKEAANAFTEDKQILLGFSPYEKRPGFLNAFIRFETIYTAIQYISFALAGNPYMGVGRNLAYRKSLFLDNKGFNHYMHVTGGDDDLFVNQHATPKNTGVFIGANCITYSLPKESWKAYFAQKKRHLSVGKLYGFGDKLKLGLLQVAHILFWTALIPSAVLLEQPYWLIGGLMLKLVFQGTIFHFASRKLGTRFGWHVLPLIDFLYCFYYITIGVSALFAKRIKWK